MNPKALEHFAKVDSTLFSVWQELDKNHLLPDAITTRPPKEFFVDLCEAIIGQQLSGKAAHTIWKRVLDLLPDNSVEPHNVLALTPETLRAVGVSGAKAKYLHSLAETVASGKINLSDLPNQNDEIVIAELTQVKGIGRWTAEMFLMFGLGREDIFSTGDLGLKNAIIRWYKEESLTPTRMLEISAPWSPYRTWAARILWKSLELA